MQTNIFDAVANICKDYNATILAPEPEPENELFTCPTCACEYRTDADFHNIEKPESCPDCRYLMTLTK